MPTYSFIVQAVFPFVKTVLSSCNRDCVSHKAQTMDKSWKRKCRKSYHLLEERTQSFKVPLSYFSDSSHPQLKDEESEPQICLSINA